MPLSKEVDVRLVLVCELLEAVVTNLENARTAAEASLKPEEIVEHKAVCGLEKSRRGLKDSVRMIVILMS